MLENDSGSEQKINLNIDGKQKELLQKFRDAVNDVLKPEHDDYYLVRWLRARNFDLKKSELMLRNHVKWRKQVSVDTVLTDFKQPEVIEKYFTGGHCGFAKDGHPVWIDPFGKIDLKGILRSVKKSEAMKSRIYIMETFYNVIFKEQSEKVGKRINQIVVIYDLDKCNKHHLWKPGIDFFCEMIAMVEDNYPETLKIAFVINAPRIFPVLFHLVKPFLAEETAKKIQIFGGTYKDELLKYIDSDQLPVHWGGSCSEGGDDIRCSSKICQGGIVPKEYYKKFDLDLVKYTSVSVGRGSSLQLDYTVKLPNSIIRWQFSTDGYDIGFGVYRRTKDSRQKAGEMEECIPTQRTNSHILPEDGSICCSQIGTYVIRFDNTYSWTRSKTVQYLVEILEPEDGMSIKSRSSQVSVNSSRESEASQ